MLKVLKKNGHEIEIVGATVFDSLSGANFLEPYKNFIEARRQEKGYFAIEDDQFKHYLTITDSVRRSEVTLKESDKWHRLYENRLRVFRPDLVFYFGGSAIEQIIPKVCRQHGVPSVAYLVNENYHGTGWCFDTDLIITDTQATADLYKSRANLRVVPVGKFVETEYLLERPLRKKDIDFLFVNPRPEKGVFIFGQLAHYLTTQYSKTVAVVNSRGKWSDIKDAIPSTYDVSQVKELPHQGDMASLLQRTKVLLLPSLWRESGSRLIIEAGTCGVPVAYTDVGGSKELAGDSEFAVCLPEELHEKPYIKLAPPQLISDWAAALNGLVESKSIYAAESKRIKDHVKKFNAASSYVRLMQAVDPFNKLQVGDRSFAMIYRERHSQNLLENFPSVTENVERRIISTCLDCNERDISLVSSDNHRYIWEINGSKFCVIEGENRCSDAVDVTVHKNGWSVVRIQ